MLSYFPRPYPDELLYSVLARYHRHTCSLSPKRTLDDLYGRRNVRAAVGLPGHLGALARRLPPELGLDPERLAMEFTLFPYHVAFQPPNVIGATLASLVDGLADGVNVRLGLAAGAVAMPKALRFCPACHADAVARWGERYWRRAHQLAGAMVCPDHGTLLASSAVAVVGDRQNEFVAATDDNCRADAQSPSWIEDDACRAMLLDVATRSAALLATPPAGATFAELTACYRRALIERQFVSAHGHVSERKLHDAFAAASAPVRNVLPEAAEIEWLSSIARKHRHAFHPLHHVLFRSFLDRSPIETTSVGVGSVLAMRKRLPVADPEFAQRLRELVGRKFGLRATAGALGVDANTIRLHAGRIGLATPWRSRPTASRPGKEALGPTIRERWLALQRMEPSLGRKSRREALGRARVALPPRSPMAQAAFSAARRSSAARAPNRLGNRRP